MWTLIGPICTTPVMAQVERGTPSCPSPRGTEQVFTKASILRMEHLPAQLVRTLSASMDPDGFVYGYCGRFSDEHSAR